MASYTKNNFEDGDILYADNLNNIENGIETIGTNTDECLKKMGMISTINPDRPKNIFTHVPLLEKAVTGDYVSIATYDEIENVISFECSHAYRLYNGEVNYPVVFERDGYYTFSGYFKYEGEVTEGDGLTIKFRFRDGYVISTGLPNAVREYTEFEFKSGTLLHGDLVDLYFSYGTAGNTIYLKDLQIERGHGKTEYEKPAYVRTAIDYEARNKLATLNDVGKFEVVGTKVLDDDETNVSVELDKPCKEIMASITLPSAMNYNFAGFKVRLYKNESDLTSGFTDVGGYWGSTFKKHLISVKINDAFTKADVSSSNGEKYAVSVAGYSTSYSFLVDDPLNEAKCMRFFSLTSNEDHPIPAGSTIKIYGIPA